MHCTGRARDEVCPVSGTIRGGSSDVSADHERRARCRNGEGIDDHAALRWKCFNDPRATARNERWMEAARPQAVRAVRRAGRTERAPKRLPKWLNSAREVLTGGSFFVLPKLPSLELTAGATF